MIGPNNQPSYLPGGGSSGGADGVVDFVSVDGGGAVSSGSPPEGAAGIGVAGCDGGMDGAGPDGSGTKGRSNDGSAIFGLDCSDGLVDVAGSLLFEGSFGECNLAGCDEAFVAIGLAGGANVGSLDGAANGWALVWLKESIDGRGEVMIGRGGIDNDSGDGSSCDVIGLVCFGFDVGSAGTDGDGVGSSGGVSGSTGADGFGSGVIWCCGCGIGGIDGAPSTGPVGGASGGSSESFGSPPMWTGAGRPESVGLPGVALSLVDLSGCFGASSPSEFGFAFGRTSTLPAVGCSFFRTFSMSSCKISARRVGSISNSARDKPRSISSWMSGGSTSLIVESDPWKNR